MKEGRKIKVYLDTSVISYLDQQDAPEKMQETQEVWERIKADQYDIFISDVVLRELEDCQEEKRSTLFGYLTEIKYNLVTVDEETMRLTAVFSDPTRQNVSFSIMAGMKRSYHGTLNILLT